MAAVIHLNQNVWWYFARAGGLVAWGLLAATVFWGLIFAGRLTRKKPTPAWNLDIHRFLGGLSVIFVAIHVSALMADRYVSFGLPQVLVPFASHWRPGAVAWGITAFYLLVAVEMTSLAMRWLPRKAWRTIHMGSFLLFTCATIHAIQSGTDTARPLVRGIGIVLLATATVALVLRIAQAQRRVSGRAQRPVVAAPAAREATTPVVRVPAPLVLTAESLVWTPPLAAVGRDTRPWAPTDVQPFRPAPPLPHIEVPRPDGVLVGSAARSLDRPPPAAGGSGRPGPRPLARPAVSRAGVWSGRQPEATQWPPARKAPKVTRFAEPPPPQSTNRVSR